MIRFIDRVIHSPWFWGMGVVCAISGVIGSCLDGNYQSARGWVSSFVANVFIVCHLLEASHDNTH